MTLSEMATEMLEHVDAFRNPSCEGLYAKIHALCVAVLAKESTATCGVLPVMTPEQRAAMERLRHWNSGQVVLAYDDDPSDCSVGGDRVILSDALLLDYHADDTCELTRQELIAEVARLKKRDTGAVC